jgi:hypothetical protein
MPRYSETAENKPENVRFYSKAQNYQILVRPYIVEVNNGIPMHKRGEKIEFMNGEFVTDSKKVIEFLRNHKAYGVDFVEDMTPSKKAV